MKKKKRRSFIGLFPDAIQEFMVFFFSVAFGMGIMSLSILVVKFVENDTLATFGMLACGFGGPVFVIVNMILWNIADAKRNTIVEKEEVQEFSEDDKN